MDKHVFGFPGSTSGSNLKKLGLMVCQVAMPGILSTNNPVVKVSGLRPSTLTTGLLVLILSDKICNDCILVPRLRK